MVFKIDYDGSEPIYRQLVSPIEHAVHDGRLEAGEHIPSMNELAARLGISRETVKKAYGILVEKGLIIPRHGKGFYAADIHSAGRPQVLVIIDKFSIYKQILFNSFAQTVGEKAELTIVSHSQSIDLLEYYLNNYLDNFDYYVVTPHFPLDDESQSMARRQLSRIPNRKLIMLDHMLPDYPGNYGAVYQDFENDIYNGLSQGLEKLRRTRSLRVITLPSSLYGQHIHKGIERFTSRHRIPVEFMTSIPEDILPGDTFLVLNSQLDAGLVSLTHRIQEAGLSIGKDVFIISYNEFDMNELILGGLTTVSADFAEMGRLAADMILNHSLTKVHCPFRMNRRKTF